MHTFPRIYCLHTEIQGINFASFWLFQSSELVIIFIVHALPSVLLLHVVPMFLTGSMSSLDSGKRIDSVIYQISNYELENYCSSLETQ